MGYESMSDDELSKIIKTRDQYSKNTVSEVMNEMKKRGLDTNNIPKSPNVRRPDITEDSDSSHIKSVYTSSKQITGNNFWISGLRFVAWAMFLTIVLVGLISGVTLMQSGESGFGILVMLLSFIVAFLNNILFESHRCTFSEPPCS